MKLSKRFSFFSFLPFRPSALLPFCLSAFFPFCLSAQLNMLLQDSMRYNVGVNDVCGWAAPDGKEYALVGLNTGVSIVDINQDTIHEVVMVPGTDNLWRDINTYEHYAYVSSEAQIGLLIIDLQYLPDSVHTWVWKAPLPTPSGDKPFLKAHSLWTDQKDGLLFLNGSNLNSGGVIICDINTDPTNPQFLGYGPAIYTHDCYSRDSIMYSAEIYAGTASIYDIHDPANVVLLGSVKTPYEFTHNTWLSDDSHVMFTTDERPSSYVTSYDITDPANIKELDRYRQASTEGSGNIVHNVYIWNDWAVVAYYANGTTIVDAAHPDNLVEVGNFDSFLGPDGAFPGVWGSYPFLPSGKILSSDRNNGLFVFIPNYVRACYFEGTVVDSITHMPLDNATLVIQSAEVIFPQLTKPDGTFKMGKAIPGQYEVKVTRPGYFDKTITFDFENGVTLNPVIELRPFPAY
ncbi:MAG TPA: choice-of-anchor B family protein, partial [Saprospiraceae bacterium]|nr:choice-of-anchor B family protein [Saprospiraceae bacterium]